MKSCYEKMDELEQLVKKAGDVLECRIEAVLEGLAHTPLTHIPEDEDAVTSDEFLRITARVCQDAVVSITRYGTPTVMCKNQTKTLFY